MQLFSKRNNITIANQHEEFLKDSLRFRLLEEIKYLTSTNKFLERCFLVEDEKDSRWFLEEDSIRDLSLRELGYNMTRFFDFKDFSLNIDEGINDYVLFDLIEILLIFTKEKNRKSVRERLQKHFMEEGDQYIVHDFLIAQKDLGGLKPFVSFLKDKILKEKFEEYYIADSNPIKDYCLFARISADIIQFLFSGEKKNKTKLYSEKLIKELAEKCVDKDGVKQFSDLLNKIVINAKSLNNEISNIRHTDRGTLLIDNPSMFKLIQSNNIYLAELVIFANPEKYFFSQKAVDFKNEYISKYDISVEGWIIKNPEKEDEEVNIADIPF